MLKLRRCTKCTNPPRLKQYFHKQIAAAVQPNWQRTNIKRCTSHMHNPHAQSLCTTHICSAKLKDSKQSRALSHSNARTHKELQADANTAASSSFPLAKIVSLASIGELFCKSQSHAQQRSSQVFKCECPTSHNDSLCSLELVNKHVILNASHSTSSTKAFAVLQVQ